MTKNRETPSHGRTMRVGRSVLSGRKAELIDRILTRTRRNLSARDAVEDEESPNLWEDDTTSSDSDDSCDDSESSDSNDSSSDSSG